MKKHFRKIVKITLTLVYLVILAGATVRMTGSGMGCPDWPKCFGYYIPPTQKSQLLWHPHEKYKKGQIIIVEESLRLAKRTFTTGSEYNPNNWAPYTKHNYAIFNPYHTWVEYINRLFGALAGLATFVMAVVSLYFWKENKIVPFLSWLTFFTIGFQGWLGATVVYSVLAPVKITLHTAVALALVALLLYLLHYTRKKQPAFKADTAFRKVLMVAFLISLLQMIAGTQVRQFIDEQVAATGAGASSGWLHSAPIVFYLHRSLSLLLAALYGWLYWRNKKQSDGYFRIKWLLLSLLITLLAGVLMNYADFPFGSQAIHLVGAMVLFSFHFYLLLDSQKLAKS